MAAFWECGCLGVEVGVRTARSARRPEALRACFLAARATRPARVRLVRALRAAGVVRAESLRLAVAIERPRVRGWRTSLRPVAIGTGEHASTRQSLRLLESCLRPGERVADLGTGTGILAMAASLLGARSVLAVDDDQAALGVARACLEDNGLAGRVTLRREDAGRAVLAGFLVEDEADPLKHGRACGLRLLEPRRSPPWSALLLERARDGTGRQRT